MRLEHGTNNSYHDYIVILMTGKALFLYMASLKSLEDEDSTQR